MWTHDRCRSEGKTRPAFRYFDKGDMATIGRMAAVAKVEWPFKAHMSGFLAWITWITVHIFFLIGFRNRISVFAAWIWTYFTFTRGARLITGDQNLPGWKDQFAAGPAGEEADRGRRVANSCCALSSKLVKRCSTWDLSGETWN